MQAPWSGQFLLNVTFNGKWGGKQNSFVVNGGAPQTVAFPQTDEQGRFNPYRDNNEILPQAIYDIAANIRDNYGNIKWYLAEIGIAMDRQSEGEPGADGVIDDTFRIQLMEEHLVQLHRAIADGANCFGVHQWTFIDNWSWINACKRRYGFWRLDLETGERQIKRNALWFAELATSNGFTSDK